MWEDGLEICREMSESDFIHMSNPLVELPCALQMCMSPIYQAPGGVFFVYFCLGVANSILMTIP